LSHSNIFLYFLHHIRHSKLEGMARWKTWKSLSCRMPGRRDLVLPSVIWKSRHLTIPLLHISRVLNNFLGIPDFGLEGKCIDLTNKMISIFVFCFPSNISFSFF
jgi:hypothetical protein